MFLGSADIMGIKKDQLNGGLSHFNMAVEEMGDGLVLTEHW